MSLMVTWIFVCITSIGELLMLALSSNRLALYRGIVEVQRVVYRFPLLLERVFVVLENLLVVVETLRFKLLLRVGQS